MKFEAEKRTLGRMSRPTRYVGYFPVLVMFVYLAGSPSSAQAQWLIQNSHTIARLRGISAVSERAAWASGSNGTVLRTTDSGETWVARPVPGGQSLDFRDVEAFDADTAYILSIGEGDKSRIYKTTDGGVTWALQFKNQNPKAFFDSFAFWDRDHGIALSDPVDGRFILIRTIDGGRSWNQLPSTNLPAAIAEEGAFAASGTCISVLGSGVWFVTGGRAARVFRSADRGETWRVASTPIVSGEAESGIFSVAFADPRNGIVVGGNYKREQDATNNVATTNDGGQTWATISRSRPRGYRSAVAYLPGSNGRVVIAVGPSGTDCSIDGGRNWIVPGTEGFDAISFSHTGSGGWATGDGGRIARFISCKSVGAK